MSYSCCTGGASQTLILEYVLHVLQLSASDVVYAVTALLQSTVS
jgi:hypothetical protein